MQIDPLKPIEFKGLFRDTSPEQTVGKNNSKVRLVDIEVGDKVFQIEFFGQRIPGDLEQFRRGDPVRVSLFISQREWNGRVFTKLSGTEIVSEAERPKEGRPEVVAPKEDSNSKGDDEFPF